MRERQRLPIFASPKPTSARSSLDRGNRGVAEDNFCGLVRHDGRDYETNAALPACFSIEQGTARSTSTSGKLWLPLQSANDTICGQWRLNFFGRKAQTI